MEGIKLLSVIVSPHMVSFCILKTHLFSYDRVSASALVQATHFQHISNLKRLKKKKKKHFIRQHKILCSCFCVSGSSLWSCNLLVDAARVWDWGILVLSVVRLHKNRQPCWPFPLLSICVHCLFREIRELNI